MTTVGDVLARALRARGVTTSYGFAPPGLAAVPVGDPAVAGLFAEAHRRVHPTGAVTVHDGVLDLRPADPAPRDPATDADPPIVVVADEDGLRAALAGRVARLRLDLDLEAPADAGSPPVAGAPDRWVEPFDEDVERLIAADAPVMLVGPGLVRAGAVPGLHALAATAHLGVLNTWGAKGVFDWRSRHHLATAGLQRDDYVRGGLADADLIVTCGLDPDEAPTSQWHLAPTIDLDPGTLDPLSARWSRAPTPITVPALRAGLAGVTQRGWSIDDGPLPPTRLTRSYSQLFGTGGLLAADAGLAGFWVARTYATTELGAVQVPGRRRPGLAAACAAVARLADPFRAVLAVVDAGVDGHGAGHGLDGATAAVLDAAATLGIPVPVEGWAADGPGLSADVHADRLRALVTADRPAPVVIGTAGGQRVEIEGVAGPIVAWGGVP